MRTLIDLPPEDVHWLDAKASDEGKSRAALVREAVAAFRTESNNDWIKRGAGYWKDRGDIGDPVEHQRAIRQDRAVD